MNEVTWEERMEMTGQTVIPEERAFHQAWRTYNRSVGFGQAVGVMDERDIKLMHHFFQAGQQIPTVPVFHRSYKPNLVDGPTTLRM